MEENMCEWQPKATKVVVIETVVKSFGDSLGVSLSLNCSKDAKYFLVHALKL
jgi:hypothetical protein